ncbi:hypothetical protein [Sphaerisporangium dianthi]|uniref:Uncharacterized protein n=1 Tax=Sphaerisporangium dianthi TaxID=1436120 RepID=A0ABV9CLB9_9ACTN
MQTPAFPAKLSIAIVTAVPSGTIGGTIGIGRCITTIPGITWD